MRLGLLAAAALGCPADLAAARPGPVNSLVTAAWADDMPDYRCPSESICVVILREARVVRAQTLSGPAVPSQLLVRFGMHATPVVGARLVLVVQRRRGRPHWQALWLDQVEPGDAHCLPVDLLREWRIPIPKAAQVRDGDACFVP